MGILIELSDQDYKYCLDYANGKINVFALNNTSRVIKAVANGIPCEIQLKADKVAILEDLKADIKVLPIYNDPIDIADLIQEKINSLKEREDGTNEKTSD